MSKFYPQAFPFWRPHLLILLLLPFLKLTFNCNWGGPGAYEESCNDQNPCHDAFECDATKEKCLCPNSLTFKLFLYYDKTSEQCVSAVGKLCSGEWAEEDGLWKIGCVPYANCVRAREDLGVSHIFGVCQCRPFFEVTEDLLCRPDMEALVGSEDPMWTATQVGGMEEEGDIVSQVAPEDRDMFKVEVKGSPKQDKRVSTSFDKDKNRHLGGRVDFKMERSKPISTARTKRGPARGSGKSAGASNDCSASLSVLIVVVLNA